MFKFEKRKGKTLLRKLIVPALLFALLFAFAAPTLAASAAYEATQDMLLSRVALKVEKYKINYASLYNIEKVARADLRAAGEKALESKGKVFFNFETLVDNKIVGRITVNPHQLKSSDGYLNMMIDISSSDVISMTTKAKNHFQKNVAVIRCMEDHFNMPVTIAAKVDVSGMDKENLVAYYYDAKEDTFTRLGSKNCVVDELGFVYVHANQAGYIVVVDAA
ncbi:hypothetical protein LJC42_06295 [Eubacteriales bacterium OttesenSCG-928-K08]|nr:hypothetical protein [Eubacteriales bacterium OttesenSCG-928-K08]